MVNCLLKYVPLVCLPLILHVALMGLANHRNSIQYINSLFVVSHSVASYTQIIDNCPSLSVEECYDNVPSYSLSPYFKSACL